MIVFPAQLGTSQDYDEFIEDVANIDGRLKGRIITVPLQRIDWIVSVRTS